MERAKKPTSKNLKKVLQKPRWEESEARIVVAAWKRSGTSMSEFSRRHGIHLARLQRWKSQIGAKAGRDGGKPHFVPVRIQSAGRDANTDGSGVEVVLEGGRRIHVGRNFDPETLIRLVAMLERS
jgi:transposase-like protein